MMHFSFHIHFDPFMQDFLFFCFLISFFICSFAVICRCRKTVSMEGLINVIYTHGINPKILQYRLLRPIFTSRCRYKLTVYIEFQLQKVIYPSFILTYSFKISQSFVGRSMVNCMAISQKAHVIE